MNPAALKANLRTCRAARPDRQHRRVHQAQPGQGRLRGEPARGRHAGVLPRARRRADLDRRSRRSSDFDMSRKDAERAKNMFALGLLSWLYHRPTEGTLALPGGQVRQQAGDPRGQPGRVARPAGTSARPPRTSRSTTRSSRRRCRPGAYRNISGNLALAYGLVAGGAAGRPAAVPRVLPDHPGVRHPARAVASTSASASRPSRPRTRSPASARRWAPRSAARSA